jgi:hypothetical protein
LNHWIKTLMLYQSSMFYVFFEHVTSG